MNIKHISKSKCAQARGVFQEDGIVKLLIICITFLIKPIYSRQYFYLFKNQLNLTRIKSELSNHKPKINIAELTFKVVTLYAEADTLYEECFEFRSYPYIFSDYTNYTKLLVKLIILTIYHMHINLHLLLVVLLHSACTRTRIDAKES